MEDDLLAAGQLFINTLDHRIQMVGVVYVIKLLGARVRTGQDQSRSTTPRKRIEQGQIIGGNTGFDRPRTLAEFVPSTPGTGAVR